MLFNYHTHTYRCGHALGSEREYIERAIGAGVGVLGFSDHVPMTFPNGYESKYRIPRAELDDYIYTLESLRAEYRGDIEIKIGFEAEYYPHYFDKMMKMLEPYRLDYFILGQHFVNNEYPHGIYSGSYTADRSVLKMYVDEVLEGLSSGLFTYVAHPDLICYDGPAEIYEEEIRRLCLGCRKMNIPLEINLHGLFTKRYYPSERFFKIAADTGNSAVIGWDAHEPDEIANISIIEEAESLAKRVGIKLLDSIELLPPK